MAERVYVGDQEVYVPKIGRLVKPGETVDIDVEKDDPLFVTQTEAGKRKRAAKKES